MNAKGRRITKAQVAVLEKRVISYWLEKYAGKKRQGEKRSGARFDSTSRPSGVAHSSSITPRLSPRGIEEPHP